MYDKDNFKIIITLNEYGSIDENGKLFVPSHNVYERISDSMKRNNLPMTSKHVYTTLSKNRHGFLDLILNIYFPDRFTIRENVEVKKLFESSVDPTNRYSIHEFIILLSQEEWLEIKPDKKKKKSFSSLKKINGQMFFLVFDSIRKK